MPGLSPAERKAMLEKKEAEAKARADKQLKQIKEVGGGEPIFARGAAGGGLIGRAGRGEFG